MTDQQPAKPRALDVAQIAFFVLSCYLIGIFLYRALLPAHEYSMRTEQLITAALDALCLIGLIGTRTRGPKTLFWVALIAGIGLFAIRMTDDAAWWTGHLRYSLPPR
jgi:hypothetical protein